MSVEDESISLLNITTEETQDVIFNQDETEKLFTDFLPTLPQSLNKEEIKEKLLKNNKLINKISLQLRYQIILTRRRENIIKMYFLGSLLFFLLFLGISVYIEINQGINYFQQLWVKFEIFFLTIVILICLLYIVIIMLSLCICKNDNKSLLSVEKAKRYLNETEYKNNELIKII